MNLHPLFHNICIVLASSSPRRRQLLEELNIPLRIVKIEAEEKINPSLSTREQVENLAKMKGEAYALPLEKNEILLSADTMVEMGEDIFGKPGSPAEAIQMLSQLSGNEHSVYTGVYMKSVKTEIVFSEKTTVRFAHIPLEFIKYYVEHFNPLDKAGAYGIQDWIGLGFVKEIEGSYTNIVGLPTQQVFQSIVRCVEELG